MIQKCKFQQRNDPPICVISFLELRFLDPFFTQIGGSIWCFVLALCVTVTTRWGITCLHGWSGKLWIILLGRWGGEDLWGRYSVICGSLGVGPPRINDPRTTYRTHAFGVLSCRLVYAKQMPFAPTCTFHATMNNVEKP